MFVLFFFCSWIFVATKKKKFQLFILKMTTTIHLSLLQEINTRTTWCTKFYVVQCSFRMYFFFLFLWNRLIHDELIFFFVEKLLLLLNAAPWKWYKIHPLYNLIDYNWWWWWWWNKKKKQKKIDSLFSCWVNENVIKIKLRSTPGILY